jgi:hypothetical protein
VERITGPAFGFTRGTATVDGFDTIHSATGRDSPCGDTHFGSFSLASALPRPRRRRLRLTMPTSSSAWSKCEVGKAPYTR